MRLVNRPASDTAAPDAKRQGSGVRGFEGSRVRGFEGSGVVCGRRLLRRQHVDVVSRSGVSILVVDLGELVVSSAQPEKMIASPTKATDQVVSLTAVG